MGVIQESVNKGVSIAMLLYRTSDKYKAKMEAEGKQAKFKELQGKQEQYSKAIQESGLGKKKQKQMSEQYVDPIREQRIAEGDVSALKEKLAMDSMDSAKNEKRMRTYYRDAGGRFAKKVEETK